MTGLVPGLGTSLGWAYEGFRKAGYVTGEENTEGSIADPLRHSRSWEHSPGGQDRERPF